MSSSIPELFVLIKNARYLAVDSPPPHKYRGKGRSPVWMHGQSYSLERDADIEYWRCKHCSTLCKLHNGQISNARAHLKLKHPQVFAEVIREEEGLNSASSEVTPSQSASQVMSIKPMQKQLFFTPNIEKYRALLLRWSLRYHLPLSAFDTDEYREMQIAVNTAIEPYLVTDTTLSNWVRDDCIAAQLEIRQLLANAKSRIHLSFDIWTTPYQTYALLGVVAHCVIEKSTGPFKLRNQTVLLALRRLRDKHSGEEMGKVIVNVIQEYDIAEKIGVFMGDNVDSNDLAVKYVLSVLEPKCKDPASRRARCCNHVINLVARDFLFGSEVEGFEHDIAGEAEGLRPDSKALKRAQDAWRKQGALGKLHNVILYIRSSVQRKEAFRKISVGDLKTDALELQPDNQTRWNSHYDSIGRALEVQDRLDIYMRKHQDEMKQDILSSKDWDYLAEIYQALSIFYDATLHLEGNAKGAQMGSVWEWLVTIEMIMDSLDDYIRQNQHKLPVPPLLVAYQSAKVKLRKYYDLSDDCHTIYAASTLMCPETRYKYFLEHWTTPDTEPWRPIMLKTVQEYYEKKYSGQHAIEQPQVKKPSRFDLYLKRVTPQDEDQFSSFINGVPTNFPIETKELTILQWWETAPYNKLRQFALDLLSSVPNRSDQIRSGDQSDLIYLESGRSDLI